MPFDYLKDSVEVINTSMNEKRRAEIFLCDDGYRSG
jgi:hypothetical protein